MLDTETIYHIAWRQAGQMLGFYLSDELLMQTVGRKMEDCFRLLVEDQGAHFPIEQFKVQSRQCWHEYVEQHGIPHKPGLLPLLDFLDEQHIPKAVATSTVYEWAIFTLGKAGIEHRFTTIVSGDQVEHGKPAPDIFLKAADKLGIDPLCCIGLEDSEAGIAAVANAGMYAIMIPDIKPPSATARGHAHQVLPTLHEVRTLIQTEWL